MLQASEKLVGVIMAAGRGTRMAPFSSSIPKSLLPICNIPLIYYHIEAMKQLGIEDVYIVVGHLGYKISRQLQNGQEFGVNIHYVEQKEMLGIAHAVGRLEPYIQDRFLLFLGDIFFVYDDLHDMIRRMDTGDCSGILAVVEENDTEAIKKNFAVFLEDGNRVKRVIEKPRYVENNLKGCGIYLFDPHIFDAIRRTPRTALRDEYELTDAIQILIEDGFQVKISISVNSDVNLTYAHDLLRCNLIQLGRESRNSAIADNVNMKGAKAVNSVIGSNVCIKQPINITNSLIMPNAVVEGSTDLNYTIVTQDRCLDCKGFFL